MEAKEQENKSNASVNQNTQGTDYRRNNSRVKSNRRRDSRPEQNKDDGFDSRIIDIRRVSRMYKGGRRMRLSVFVVVGDGKGKVGLGLGKGSDVRAAQEKAIAKAKKNLITVPLKGNTIPHEVTHKYKAARILIKPASPGTGIVAGSSMRAVAEVAGVKDMLGKIMGTNNKISNAYASVQALSILRSTRL